MLCLHLWEAIVQGTVYSVYTLSQIVCEKQKVMLYDVISLSVMSCDVTCHMSHDVTCHMMSMVSHDVT